MQSITDQTEFISSSQDEAIKNIEGSRMFDIAPDIFKATKDMLEKDVEMAKLPKAATPAVAEKIAVSPEHAAAITPEAGVFSTIENMFSRYGRQLSEQSKAAQASREYVNADYISRQGGYISSRVANRFGPETEMDNLNWRRLNGETLSEDEELQLESLYERQKDNFGRPTYGIDGQLERFPGEVVAGILDVPGAVLRNADVVADVTALSTAYHAAVGFAGGTALSGVGGAPAAAAGAATGFARGIPAGIAAASFKDAFKRTAASLYGDLSRATDEYGDPLNIDHETKRNLAFGIGVVSGALESVTDVAMLKRIPYLKRLVTPAEKVKAVLANPTLRQTALEIGKNMVTNGAEEMAQEYVQIIGEEIGNTYQNSEVSLVNGFVNATKKLGERDTIERIGMAGNVGMAVAGSIHGGSIVAGKTAETITTPHTITPEEAKAAALQKWRQQMMDPRTRFVPVETVIPSLPPDEMATQSLEAQQLFDYAAKELGKTNLAQKDPKTTSELTSAIVQKAGIKKLWFTKEALTKFADTEEKAAIVRAIIDPSGVLAAKYNQPIDVDAAKVLDIAVKFPDVTEYMQMHPEGPNPREAKVWHEKLKEETAKREKTLEELRIHAADPVQVADALKVTPEMDDETFNSKFPNRAVADAFLQKLDQHETEVRGQLEAEKKIISFKSKKKSVDAPKDPGAIYLSDLAEVDAKSDANKIESSRASIKRQGDAQRVYRQNPTTEAEFIKAAEKVGLPGDQGKFLWNLRNRALNEEQGGSQQKYAEYFGVPFIEGESMNDLDIRISEKQVSDLFQDVKDANDSIAKRKVEEEQKAKEAESTLESESQRRLEVINQTRERVKKVRDHLPSPEDAKARLEAMLTNPENSHIPLSEQDFMNEPVFSDTVRGIFPEKEVEQIEAADRAAKMSVVENINESAKWERNKVADVYEEIQRAAREQQVLEDLKNDPNLKIVDKFYSEEIINPSPERPKGTDLRANHSKPGYSLYAIDPKYLTKEQKEKYRNNPQMKKHRAFVKGGLTPEESARLLGVHSAERLLRTLAETPSREDIVKRQLELHKEMDRAAAEEAAGIDDAAIKRAYGNRTYNYLQQANYLRRNEWAAFKKGIKRVALPSKSIEAIRSEARTTVDNTKVGDLNPNKPKMGEMRSRRKALQAVLDGDLATGFDEFQNAALNNETALAMHQAIERTNRNVNFIKTLMSPKNKALLKETGFHGAVEDLLELFNFTRSKKDAQEKNGYRDFVKRQIEAGKGNFEIPERLMDTRQSMLDMSVEDVQLVTDRLRAILHQAKLKDKLLTNFGPEAQRVKTVESIAEQWVDHLGKNPDFNTDRLVEPQTATSKAQAVARLAADTKSALRGIAHILERADGYKQSGIGYELITMLQGRGKYAGLGEEGKTRAMIQLNQRIDKIIEQFGKSEWAKLRTDVVEIKEFQDSRHLNYGKMTKWEMFMMLLNTGNESNTRRLLGGLAKTGFNTNIETIRQVFETHLDEKYMVAAQQIWDTFELYRPEVAKLHKEMSGIDVEFIEPTAFEHRGKMIKGGYYPLISASEMSVDKIRRASDRTVDKMTGLTQFKLTDTFHADDMTKHSHTEERTNSNEPVNLNIGFGPAFEMILHDLYFRKPIADAMRLVTHDDVSKALVSVVGLRDYNVLVNSIVDLATSGQMEANALFNANDVFRKLESVGRSVVAVGHLVFNLGSIAIQPSSMVFTVEKMGKSGVPHIAKITQSILRNPLLLKEFYESAQEISPGIRNFLNGIDDNRNERDIISQKEPLRYFRTPGLKQLDQLFTMMTRGSSHVGFTLLGHTDVVMKVIALNAAYSQYMAGEVEGVTREALSKLTPEERDHRAKAYANKIADTTLTASNRFFRAPIQKDARFMNMVAFWNDSRNSLNNTIAMVDRARIEGKTARTTYQKARTYATAGLSLMVTLAMVRLIQDSAHGAPTPLADGDDEEKENPNATLFGSASMGEKAASMFNYLAWSPITVGIGDIPYARDVAYGFNRYVSDEDNLFTRNTSVQFGPLNRVGTESMKGIAVAMDFMDYWEGKKELTAQDARSVSYLVSLLTGGGLPIASAFKAYKALDESGKIDKASNAAREYKTEVGDRIRAFLKREEEEKGAKKLPDEARAVLEDVAEQVDPQAVAQNDIPDDYFEKVKQIESAGNWWARNPKTDAAGLYQFLKSTWEDIMRRAPELELTEAGRTSKYTAQQERAMEWFTKENARILRAKGVEITSENLYAAHFLGASGAAKVLSAAGNEKLRELTSDDVIQSNGFSNSMTVKRFKEWVAQKVNSVSNTEVAAK